jgi:SAM-dependent methyltransferase
MTVPIAIQKFVDHLQRSLQDESFAGLRLSGPTQANAAARAAEIRLILLRDEPHLSIVTHEDKRDITKNLSPAAGIDWLQNRLGTDFRNALLRTTRRDWQLHCPPTGQPKLARHAPSTPRAPSREHDTPRKTTLGPAAADWLCALGISHTNGRPKPSMADKHRQVSRYAELLRHLVQECGWTDGSAPDDAPLRWVDMGCGKGYLTFAAWHLFHRVLHRPVSIIGVETRADLVQGANRVARHVGASGLEFVRGDIAATPLPGLDGLVALHACDTATDDAIRRGIELRCKLIVVAPCCHQSLRQGLAHPEPFAPLLAHGLFKERMAEWLTDGLRTLFLEWAGYQTKVIEFVASEHTPRNLMITAIRKREPFTDPTAKQRVLDLKQLFGIEHHALDDLLR